MWLILKCVLLSYACLDNDEMDSVVKVKGGDKSASMCSLNYELR